MHELFRPAGGLYQVILWGSRNNYWNHIITSIVGVKFKIHNLKNNLKLSEKSTEDEMSRKSEKF